MGPMDFREFSRTAAERCDTVTRDESLQQEFIRGAVRLEAADTSTLKQGHDGRRNFTVHETLDLH